MGAGETVEDEQTLFLVLWVFIISRSGKMGTNHVNSDGITDRDKHSTGEQQCDVVGNTRHLVLFGRSQEVPLRK